MSKILKKTISSNWFQGFVFRFIRLYASTFRLTVENEEEWMNYLKNGGKVLLCVWHQQFFPAIRYFKNYQQFAPGLMISRSADGDLIAGVASRTGWRPARGSSSKGGKSAMMEVISHLKETGLAAHILDGPRGPIGKVKAGAISIALAAEAVIVPFYISADRAWYFNSWDKFFIPKPFARVTLRYDKMIKLQTPNSESEFEAQRQNIESIMIKELKNAAV
ncbi:MAG: lysophospholipid acyltransferase family protein [Desulfobacteraceae bacterium]|nr:lysophospholipid acyltransferase family protein [Desulfobacteraceae bacterium]MBC2755254.1 lysophospholipid acyltransferase family protein [Desulfobacteraceae bacterium]